MYAIDIYESVLKETKLKSIKTLYTIFLMESLKSLFFFCSLTLLMLCALFMIW